MPPIALGLDEPQDIAAFMNVRSATAKRRLLERESWRASLPSLKGYRHERGTTAYDSAENGERLSEAECLALMRCDDLDAVMGVASNASRRRPWVAAVQP